MAAAVSVHMLTHFPIIVMVPTWQYCKLDPSFVPKRCLKHTNLQSTVLGCFHTQQAGANMEEQSKEEARAIRGQTAS